MRKLLPPKVIVSTAGASLWLGNHFRLDLEEAKGFFFCEIARPLASPSPLQPSGLSEYVSRLTELTKRVAGLEFCTKSSALALPDVTDLLDRPLREMATELARRLKNTPYNSELEQRGRDEKPARFAYLDLIHSLRSGEGRGAELLQYLERRPGLIALPGWCGGRVIHEMAEYGAADTLKSTLTLIKDLGRIRNPMTGCEYTVQDVLSFQNHDGCTPLHLAYLHRQAQAISILRDFGADPQATDRYGRTAESYGSHSL